MATKNPKPAVKKAVKEIKTVVKKVEKAVSGAVKKPAPAKIAPAEVKISVKDNGDTKIVPVTKKAPAKKAAAVIKPIDLGMSAKQKTAPKPVVKKAVPTKPAAKKQTEKKEHVVIAPVVTSVPAKVNLDQHKSLVTEDVIGAIPREEFRPNTTAKKTVESVPSGHSNDKVSITKVLESTRSVENHSKTPSFPLRRS